MIYLGMLVLSHPSSSWLLVRGDRHWNPPGIGFPRGVTGLVPWETCSEIELMCRGLLGSALGIKTWRREEKNRKGKKRIGREE